MMFYKYRPVLCPLTYCFVCKRSFARKSR